MSKELDFIQTCLSIHPSQLVENIASDSHETRRIPDPYIFLVKDKKILTLNGEIIEKSIRNDSNLDSMELKAFLEIQEWAENNNEGTAFWFSSPFPGKYDKGKVVASQILHYYEQKILFNRAIDLDVDSKTIISIANNISEKAGPNLIVDSEELRQTPLFFGHDRLKALLNEISAYTNQSQMVEEGTDIDSKTVTYSKLLLIEKMSGFLYSNTSDSQYFYAHQIAKEQGLIGKHIGSCGQSGKLSAFEAFSKSGSQEKWDYHSGVCRVCGNSTEVGPCSICKTCEKKF